MSANHNPAIDKTWYVSAGSAGGSTGSASGGTAGSARSTSGTVASDSGSAAVSVTQAAASVTLPPLVEKGRDIINYVKPKKSKTNREKPAIRIEPMTIVGFEISFCLLNLFN
ncbi:hypothetical protein RJT34_12948 [Clitoria ternatea]|uniref:Uncharacterized protein n=1 Tax=Clitoria ternatea TaxID=43366 RepID=A0AAN9JPS6_CLITE